MWNEGIVPLVEHSYMSYRENFAHFCLLSCFLAFLLANKKTSKQKKENKQASKQTSK
jgi:hypothetical protein